MYLYVYVLYTVIRKNTNRKFEPFFTFFKRLMTLYIFKFICKKSANTIQNVVF